MEDMDKVGGHLLAFSCILALLPILNFTLVQLLSNRDNVDFLYSLFSRLLDRKMEEVRATRRDSGREDDIKDDYIKGIIGCCATGNVASSPGQQAADRQLPLLPIPSSNSHKLIRVINWIQQPSQQFNSIYLFLK
jgi:hypothetical protein